MDIMKIKLMNNLFKKFKNMLYKIIYKVISTLLIFREIFVMCNKYLGFKTKQLETILYLDKNSIEKNMIA